MSPPRRLLAAAALLAVAAGAGAESVYVIDKLLVGLHETRDLESAIVKVLPTGTLLEVIERDGDAALVEGPDGTRGWLDGGYLMEEMPAALVVDKLEADKRALQDDLGAARERIDALAAEVAAATAEGGSADADPEPEPADADGGRSEADRKLAHERLRVGELQAKISALQEQLEDRGELDDRLGELQESLAERERELETYRGATGEGATTVLAIGRLLLGSKATVLTLLVLLLVAFGAGVWLMDNYQRKRHGGFRL